MLEGPGTRRGTELAVDRPSVAVDRVVRQVELAADVALREWAAEHPQDDELPPAEHCLAVGVPGRRWSLDGGESLRQQPGIPTRCDDRPCILDRVIRGFAPVEGLQDECLPEQRVGDGARMPRQTCDDDGPPEGGYRLLELPPRRERRAESDEHLGFDLFEPVLPCQLQGLASEQLLLLDPVELARDERPIRKRGHRDSPLLARQRGSRRLLQPPVGLVELTADIEARAE